MLLKHMAGVLILAARLLARIVVQCVQLVALCVGGAGGTRLGMEKEASSLLGVLLVVTVVLLGALVVLILGGECALLCIALHLKVACVDHFLAH